MPDRLKELLSRKLTKKEISLLPSSYDMVGSILIFSDFPKELEKKEKAIGEALLLLHNNIKTVCKKTKKYSGKFRTPKLKIIAGQKTKETTYKENNTILRLDVEKVYFSSRLSEERKRIFSQVKNNESILVMFSGCGVYPIVISKNTKAKEIYGIEINPTAHKYASENLKLNKTSNVNLFLGDVNKILPKISKRFDRILMPLPKGAESFLKLALTKIKKKGIIHLYSFAEENKYENTLNVINSECKKSKKRCEILRITKCGQFSPRVYRICMDFKVIGI
jgi:tRNA (guanine37-N1)-methyltransferase